MTEFSRTDAEHGQEQFYPGEFPAALHGSPQIQCLSTVGSPSAAEKDTDKVIIITLKLPKARDAYNQYSRNQPIDFDFYKIALSDSDRLY